MGGNSTTWMNTAVLVTCMRNFRKNRGPVSGILKGYVGLSTAIFTDLCTALFSDDPSTFLLMLAIVPFVVCLAAIIFLREVPPASTAGEDKEEVKYFGVFNAVAVVVAVYLLVFDVTGPHNRLLSQAFAIVLLILLASPLSVPTYSLLLQRLNRVGSKFGSDIERQIIDPLLGQEIVAENQRKPETVVAATPEKPAVAVAEAEDGVVVEKRRPLIGEDHTISEAMRTVDFWILFVSFLCGVGTGLAVMNNMGQIGLALGYVDVSIFVSLTSIWGFFGRIGSGSISEYFIK